jgi:uncharacterized protein
MLTKVQRLEARPAKNIAIEKGFWAERQKTNREQTIPAIYHHLNVSGRLDAWRLNWQLEQPRPQIFFEADTGKWIEAVGHSLTTHPNPELEQQADALIDLIADAQQSDGYLNIFFTAVEPHNRWRNLRDGHELFNAGHLIESGVAYYKSTGKRKLLDVLCRYADHIDARFGRGEGQQRGYCGHPVIEMALVKLYRATGEKRYLNLAKFFIEERGQQPHYFDVEALERGDEPANSRAKSYEFFQAHVPIREQLTATGHAVRACYLYSGLADLVYETGDETLLEASRLFWDDLTHHQMYITGGVGPNHADESLTFAYDLPNETAYAETCASVALVFWAHRMFHIDPNSRYIDVMERALYNGVLSGVSFNGRHFFYSNPLASYPNINPAEHWSGIQMDRFYQRSEWFKYACCPPNLARLVASIGGYFYSTMDDTVYVHLYNQNRSYLEVANTNIQIEQRTNYPWDGDIHFTIRTDHTIHFNLALRIPGWCRDFYVMMNGIEIDTKPINGYIWLREEWVNGDEITLSLAMPVERIAPHPNIRQDVGCIALQRGPVVYCLEEADNESELATVVIPRHTRLATRIDADLFNGISVISGEAMRIKPVSWPGGLYQPQSLVPYSNSRFTFRAIPYCFWANREPGEMRVWIREM